jgi:RNA polymerase sigma factor (sigma-70 family)
MDCPDPLAHALAQMAAGDLGARDRVIALWGDQLRRLARRMLAGFPAVRRYEDTDDVFQGAAIRLHRALGDLAAAGEAPRSLAGLAATQVRRELLDLARRHSGPAGLASNFDTNVAPGEDRRLRVDLAAAVPDALERWQAFHEAVGRLPEDEREVVHLAWFLGADQRTIAALVGCSERTVKNRWRRARSRLQEALAGEPPE